MKISGIHFPGLVPVGVVTAILGLLLHLPDYSLASPTPQALTDNLDASEKFGAPLIIPSQTDVVLDVGTNYTLVCRSQQPVTWRIPEIHSMIDYTIAPFEKPSSSLPFGSSLFLQNIQVENVGKYYCIETEFNSTQDSDLDVLITLYRAETIYVYVNDPDRLLVPSVVVVMANQYADAIIPCKPSSKNIDVELLREDESPLDIPNRYDPTVGYVAKMIHLTDGGTFICRPKSDIYQMTYIDVRVHGCELRNNNCSKNVVMVPKNAHSGRASNELTYSTTSINNFTTPSSTTSTLLVNTTLPSVSNQFYDSTKTPTNAITESLINKTQISTSYPATIAATTNYLIYTSATTFGRRRRGQDSRRRHSHTDYINRPIIHSEANGHAIEGGILTLECSVDIRPSVQFSINWTLPKNNAAVKEGRVTVTNTTKELNPRTTELEIGRNKLIVRNVGEDDTGYYTCGVLDHSGNKNKEFIYVKILRQGESYINMSEPSNHYTIETSVKKRRTKMLIKYKAYPEPIFTWYNNKGEEIKLSDKYTIEQKLDSILLEIRNIDIGDTGEYVLKAYNSDIEKELKFKLFVKDKPTVKMEEVYYVQSGETVNVICECAAYPKSQISWTWIPCQIKPKWPSCFPASSSKFQFNEVIVPENADQLEELENNSYRTVEMSILVQRSELKFIPNQPGFVKCSAQNSEGNDTTDSTILLGDLTESFTIYGVDEKHLIAAGDDVSLTCGVLAYNYSANIDWYKNESLIESNHDWQVEYTESEYSYKKRLAMKNIGYDKSGIYECRANLIDDGATAESRFISVEVHEPEAPVITHSNLENSKIGKKLGELLYLECHYKGIPEPVISWFKDDVRLEFGKNDSRRFLDNRDSTLSIPFIKPEDEGTYKCVVSNRLGSVEKSASVTISNLPGLRLPAILGIIGLFIVLILLIIYLVIRFCREKKLRKELKAAGLANFEEGAPECINPALSLDEQADLLPYDRNFEFPKEKLKLGKQLGAGAFGVVLKASAEGILPDEKETTVAVKMVKKTADNEVMKALVSELKIMVHLGKHLNVVNLLGAITKNIAKREVMIIVEYCRFGNVQNFLLKNRKNFINQINPKTDEFDPTILTNMRTSGDYEFNSKHPDDASRTYVRQSGADYIGANVNSATTEMTTIPGEEVILSNNSIQPAWRSNYKSDVSESMEISTKHLISWAFQVARGMDYLASRKVLHGDLAARNILLCEDNIVKICDFGLARSMYRSSNYKKHGEAPLPIKWLALESMSDQIFSTHSDIWSYGIVLWEFFSLAKVPYPGMDADESLYLKLKDGYRMEKPEYANQELYDIMLECWSTNPEMRPPFGELEKRFARMLGEDVTNHYIDLNDTYLKMNSEYYKTGKVDYLSIMGCPEELAPQAPRYVNGNLIAEMAENSPKDSDYVQMHPKSGNAIFSPRPQDDYVRADHFTFPAPISPTISNNLDSPSAKNRKKGVIPEEVPMLNRNAGSDSETEHSPDAISSPSKQFTSLNKLPDSKTGVPGGDNYVNVQGNDKSKLRTKDAFSNPEYLMLNNVNEKRK